jgi:hypothetical protein
MNVECEKEPLMLQAKQILYPALAVAVAAGGYLIGNMHGQAKALQSINDRLASIESKQRTFETGYLNGIARPALAEQLGYQAHAPSAMSQPQTPGTDLRAPVAPQVAARQQQEKLLKLQKDFRAEPLNPKWAGDTQRQIEDALVSAGEEGNVVPKGMQADCRSRSCMIDLDLANSTEADILSEAFLTGISGRLPITTMIQTPSADGTRIVLHIMATAKPSS